MPGTHHGIFIHLVFGTKRRQRCLADSWRDELFAYIGGTAEDHKAIVLKSGGVEDHVHLLLKIHPAYALAETVKLIKANSSRWINQTQRTRTRFAWQRGYAAFSVSQSRLKSVKDYIHTQRAHHTRLTFRDEYVALLRKHRIEFDERYVFDDEVTG